MRELAPLLLIAGVALVFLTGSRAPVSPGEAQPVRPVQTLTLAELGISQPAGLAFSAESGALLVLHAGETGSASEIVSVSTFGEYLGSAPVAARLLPGALIFDVAHPAPAMAAAGTGGIRDELGVRSLPGPFEVAEARMLPAGLEEARGVAFHPGSGHLYVLTPDHRLYELSATREVVGVRDLSSLELRDPRGIVFAPSADRTDDPSRMSLFVGDVRPARTGASVDAASPDPVAVIVEASLAVPASAPAAVPTFSPIVANILEANEFSPPSPDTAGLAYRADLARLVITDSEVNETRIFEDTNIWETSLTGTVVSTGVTSNFMEPGSEEPTGIAFDTRTGHYFISDDSEKVIWEVDPGPDKRVGTGDDVVSSIDTTEFDSEDPEGVSLDKIRGHLYIADGVNDEVYRLRPGSNGVFDGVPPDGDDVLTQFDSEVLGIHDPEGIEYNPDSDTLYISGSELIAETTRSGTLLRLIDLDGLGIDKPAGLAYAPATTNPALMHLYVADRGEDNDSSRNENDGRIFELTLVDEPGILDLRVNASRDDAEEEIIEGSVTLGGGDLELGFDDDEQQVVGIRFRDVEMLRGTPILEAWVQFTAEDESEEATQLTIRGQLSGNAPIFDSSDYDVSSRPTTQASVSWSPTPWVEEGDAGEAQRTPDLSSVIQEVVSQPGWAEGNSLVLIVRGTGWRVAESYDGTPEAAPLLHVRFPPPDCGNGAREIGEQCDGNDFGSASCSDQGCSGGSLLCTSLCRFDVSSCTGCPVCGNSAVEFGEDCDDGNAVTEECSYQETACQVCDAECKLVAGATSFCGDGIVDAANGEECDDANLDDSDACTNACRIAICGDGIVQTGVEECDDGNASNVDACLDTCALAFCGDGFVRPGFEECDDANLDNTDACLDTCLSATCGDGFVHTGFEACDDANLDDGDACLTTCEAAICGDGFTWAGVEDCDDANLDNTDGCLDTCAAASCGDGFVQTGIEECDDANADNTDACLDTCIGSTCGDGFLWAGFETCDDGNASDTDACLTTCEAAACGDGIVWSGVEECDDANQDDSDGCLNSCEAASCGDGIVWAGVEECDDANADDGDACLSTCVAATCGDGFVQAGVEICDDANADNTDACLDSCEAASCGDGYVWSGVEECDDGNSDNRDGCLDICVVPEPSETLLLLAALGLIGGLARRKSAVRDV